MANFAEEQEMEREALESMFPEEYKSESNDTFLLDLTPGTAEDFVRAPLKIQYPANYPDEGPIVSFHPDIPTGMSDQKEQALNKIIEQTIEENLGMAMIYTLAEAVQDYLRENNVSEVSMHDLMLNRQKEIDGPPPEAEEAKAVVQEKEEDMEWKGLEEKELVALLLRVKVEEFKKWKEVFDAELIAEGKIRIIDKTLMTGKKIFQDQQTGKENMKTLEAEDEEDEEEEIDEDA